MNTHKFRATGAGKVQRDLPGPSRNQSPGHGSTNLSTTHAIYRLHRTITGKCALTLNESAKRPPP
ncbi:hypothetical protein PGR6_31190 [Pseudomonas sp. GR 6-02]|nr:hypothetical protein PGR6_31190 [Pseudomonas sp. GR 6-02]